MKSELVIASECVIADLIRNPCFVWHWIPDQVRDDSLQVRDDSLQAGMTTFRSGVTAFKSAMTSTVHGPHAVSALVSLSNPSLKPFTF
jgi:hypothetical protein